MWALGREVVGCCAGPFVGAEKMSEMWIVHLG